MPTPITGPTNALGALTQTATPTAPDNSLGKDAFLKLMVAQMRYQDPMKPTDPQAFMTQSAQFTQVEKLEELTKAIVSAGKTTTLSTASGLLGRVVTFALPDGSSASGVVSSASPTADGVKLKIGNRETMLDQIIDIRLGQAPG